MSDEVRQSWSFIPAHQTTLTWDDAPSEEVEVPDSWRLVGTSVNYCNECGKHVRAITYASPEAYGNSEARAHLERLNSITVQEKLKDGCPCWARRGTEG